MSKRLTTTEFIEKATKVHNGKYDYSQTVYEGNRSKVWIICPEHGPFEQQAASHMAGNGCPECAKVWSDAHKQNLQKSSRKSRGMTTEEWVERARLVHGDKYDYSKTVYVNQRTNVTIICPIHGEFTQKADSHMRGFGCRFCGFESDKRKGRHWPEGQYEKIAATCMERYGARRYLDSEEGRAKLVKILNSPEHRQKMHDIILSDEVQQKTKQTSLQRYGTEFAARTKEVQYKIYRTKKKNHTVNSSKSEEKMYEMLVQRFGKDNVDHQHKNDDRYPFICDFYVEPLDLFIELNAHWTHGYHWFDKTCGIDCEKLDAWTARAVDSVYYRDAIETWTVRDLQKRQTAVANNLNYVVFWKTDLSDFKSWLGADGLVLNNI